MKIRDLGMILNLSCEAASRLISESLDRPLTRSERLALGWHTWMCRGCRLFRRQLRALQDLAGRMPDSARRQINAVLPHLSSERKQRIKQLLSEAQRTQQG